MKENSFLSEPDVILNQTLFKKFEPGSKKLFYVPTGTNKKTESLNFFVRFIDLLILYNTKIFITFLFQIIFLRNFCTK